MQRLRCLNGTQLKIIVAVLMVFDHIHQMFENRGAPLWLTVLGRLVAPVFLFMTVEGWKYTKNKRKYMLRLLYGSLAMNVLTFVAIRLFPNEDVVIMNNIFATFLVTCWYMWCIDLIKARKIVKGILLCLVPVVTAAPILLVGFLSGVEGINPVLIKLLAQLSLVIPNLMTVEGGAIFVLIGVLMYLAKRQGLQALIIALFGALELLAGYFITAATAGGLSIAEYIVSASSIQWIMGFSAILILMYNGKRGRGLKYFFYVFYPAHIYALYILAWAITAAQLPGT